MFNFKHFLAELVLAAAAIGICGQAAAGPMYHVDVDTTSLGTGSVFLDLYFMGLAGAPAATATVTHLSGAFDGPATLTGMVTGSASGPFVFSNAGGGGELVQGIHLGGKFSFDVSFLMDPGTTGTTFGWSLFDSTHYLGVDGDLGSLSLQPYAPLAEQIVVSAPPTQLGTVRDVPEPPTVALVFGAMLGMLAIRRKGVRRS